MLLYEGKAKKIFSTENDNEFVVYYKDDATAFNGEKKAEISSKGILNNKISTIMFEELAKEGINIRVVDIHTIKPIDKEIIIKSAKETNKIITIEDHNIIGGLGTAVCEVLSEEYPKKVVRMGIKDEFGTSGKAEELMKHFKITSKDIIEKIL